MLDSIRLINFKIFADQTIPLAPLTLLSGLNGAGKSSAMQALSLLRQSHDSGLLGEHGWLLNGELVEVGAGEDVLHENAASSRLAIELGESGRLAKWEVDYVREGDVLRYPDGDNEGHPADGDGMLFGNGFQYLRADRVNPMVSYPKSFHAVSQRRFLGSRGEYAAHFLSLFQDEPIRDDSLKHPDSNATSGLLAQVNAWMQEFSPGATINVHEIEKTDFVRLSYTFGSGIDSSNPYRPTNVGFGLTYSLPIVIACLSTAAGGIVLMENPEAHLHPQGQVAMGRLMALTAAIGVQVVVETHSDHVLNGIRIAVKQGVLPSGEALVHFFRRDAATGSAAIDSPVINEQGRLSFWPDGFFDQWDKSLDELLD
jgi:predicted ATPase